MEKGGPRFDSWLNQVVFFIKCINLSNKKDSTNRSRAKQVIKPALNVVNVLKKIVISRNRPVKKSFILL